MSSESACTTDMTDDDVDPKQHKLHCKRKIYPIPQWKDVKV